LPSLRDHKRFYSWLRQIARHKCQNWRRKQINFVPLQDDLISKEPSTDEVLIQRETLAKVMEAIDNLPESEKRLLKEYYLDNVSYDELEARHGVSTKALVVRLVRARRKIRDQLEKTLSAFVAFLHDHTESILTGGAEIMKLSIKTKLIVGGILAILILGGSGVLVHYYVQNKSEQEALQTSQENYSKSPVKSISSGGKALIKNNNLVNKKVVAQVNMQVGEPEVSKGKTEDIKPKIASGTEASKTGNSETGISPELERRFVTYKELVDKKLVITQEYAPLRERFSDLVRRENELYDLLETARGEELDAVRTEIKKVSEEKTKAGDAMAPYQQRNDQLEQEYDGYFQTHYGITLQQFREAHTDTFKDWWIKNGFPIP
jgi:hypothetical protein